MKKIMMMALFLTLSSANVTVWAEPLAASANLEKMFAAFIPPEERHVPDVKDVGIPAYPESKFCTIKKNELSKTAWSEVHLLSTDSYKKVSAWYRNKLKAWRCEDLVKDESLICTDKDPGTAGPYVLDPETFNVVTVIKMDMSMPCVLQDMQTAISIKFQPD